MRYSWSNAANGNIVIGPEGSRDPAAAVTLTERDTALFNSLMRVVADACRDDAWSAARQGVLGAFHETRRYAN